MTHSKEAHLKQTQDLTLPLTQLKGVGPKRAMLLAQKGIHTVLDLLFFTPLRYEDRTRIKPIREARQGQSVLVQGRVVSGREERFYPSRKRLFKIVIEDGTGPLELIWFHYRKPHLDRFASSGAEILAHGKVQINRSRKQIPHPDLTLLGKGSAKETMGFFPVYSAVQGISPNLLRTVMKGALEIALPSVVDPVPRDITKQLGLPDLATAISSVHFPPGDSDLSLLNRGQTTFQKRLIFDRFFLVMSAIAFRKNFRKRVRGPSLSASSKVYQEFEKQIPFPLTGDQTRALQDITRDLGAGRPMNRLLLGDVGCGKTVIAAAAAFMTIRSNRQAAIMVPTQVLANQHMETFLGSFKGMGFRPVLLAGKLKVSERKAIYEGIKNGEYSLIIGTQSLIQEGVSFDDLGLVIIDEQHRFGVRERALLDRKGRNPHLLVMTATPIPRTVALTLYGDMDISFIREYPAGRKGVVTRLFTEEKKRWVFEELGRRMSEGQQVFVICPVIEGSEGEDLKDVQDMAQRLRKIYHPPYRIGIMHGRLPAEKREKAMDAFRRGAINLLVGTTVIEVGVHVPRAGVMVIEHPERFGLAQLHQLRGRVGRGTTEGLCILMGPNTITDKARTRLEVLVASDDGFEIAQKDLELRGHGELIGMRQAGLGELDLGEMMREEELFTSARQYAMELVDADPDLHRTEHRTLKGFVKSVLAKPIDV
ncbi:ATP-dependent DNA helicase RecG [Thermodesulfobacteriota bacterium]